MQSFVLELILTFILMFTILNVSTGAKEKGVTAGIAIGAVIGLEAMFAGPICGASMNPARSIAPAIVSGHLEHLWIYLTGPVAGAWGRRGTGATDTRGGHGALLHRGSSRGPCRDATGRFPPRL